MSTDKLYISSSLAMQHLSSNIPMLLSCLSSISPLILLMLSQNFSSVMALIFIQFWSLLHSQNLEQHLVYSRCSIKIKEAEYTITEKRSWITKIFDLGVPVAAQQKWIQPVTMKLWVQSMASLSGLRIWRSHELWCRSQKRLRPSVAVVVAMAVAVASHWSSDLTPSLGTSICHRSGPKKKKEKNQKNQKGHLKINNKW